MQRLWKGLKVTPWPNEASNLKHRDVASSSGVTASFSNASQKLPFYLMNVLFKSVTLFNLKPSSLTKLRKVIDSSECNAENFYSGFISMLVVNFLPSTFEESFITNTLKLQIFD